MTLSTTPSIFVALSVQISLTFTSPIYSINFFNSPAMYSFVFLFPEVSTEPRKILPVGQDSIMFINGRCMTLSQPSEHKEIPYVSIENEVVFFTSASTSNFLDSIKVVQRTLYKGNL